MDTVKKWLSERNVKKNGLYVHYSSPKPVAAGVGSAQARLWLRRGGGVVQRAVLAGQGRRLLQETPTPRPPDTALPALVAKCEALHTAVERGSLLELQELLEPEYNKRKYAQCCDEAGVGLLHKAVFYNYLDITEYLVKNYPQLVNQRDSLGRTPLHYTAASRSPAATAAAALLEGAGAARGARDAAGNTAACLARHPHTLTLPTVPESRAERQGKSLVIKRHNIRIWCHDCDMAKLQRLVWEGHGSRLLSEVSNQPVVKKFLEAVPYIMNTIREIHTAVVENKLEDLMRHAGDPVPPIALSSRDVHYMTAMHKAAGLGRGAILNYITERYPEGLNDIDNDGRTPLHYAATVRDEQHTYNTLVGLGADESIVDNKNKTPAYYLSRQQEIDKHLFKTIPDAPRTPSSAYPLSWDWKILDIEYVAEPHKKSRKKNFKVSSENISSHNNTNTISESTRDTRTGAMKTSSTHELIKDLPELDDIKKSQEDISYTKGTDIVEEGNDQETHEVIRTLKNEEHETTAEKIIETENAEDEKVIQNGENVNEESNDVNNDKNPLHETNEEASDNQNSDVNIVENSSVKKAVEEVQKLEEDAANADSEITNAINVNTEEETEVDKPISTNTDIGKTENVDESNNIRQVENEEAGNMTDNEGNNNEDDDDVQVPGDTQSEYSDSNLRSTAEASDTTSAKRGYQTNDRNTQESLIEGLVSAYPEVDSQDASLEKRDEGFEGEVLAVDSQVDPEVTELINSANMEMLAALVLNGEGARLIGRHSRNAELQAFLDNVPTYMKKIHKVHVSARDGNIRDLQAALDRRKFAIARDSISPNGATPLHIATVFGKTNIMKYLGGRFPETLSAVDFEGRSALHYAAVLPDNGHHYNLLQQLGANSKDLDDSGQSAEDYLNNPSLLPFDTLVSDFGISEDIVQEMLSDKGASNGNNRHIDIPNFQTEEGRYLAKSLGDPLIKGLTEVANVKPKDPVAFLASFLHNFPEQEKNQLGTEESNVLMMKVSPEVENEQPPSHTDRTRTATLAPAPIDVITLNPEDDLSPDAPEAAFSSINRDEHGQSMLHFSAARSHTNNALFELLQESEVSLAYRDELYRTARDVSIQANVKENTVEIDRWVLHQAARGNTDKIMELLLEGYDHILDVVDEEGAAIGEVVSQRGNDDMSNLLASIPAFEDSRETLHSAIRRNDLSAIQQAVSVEGGRTLARGKNSFGRHALHIAVLAQHEDIVAYLAHQFPELLRIGDNLERTPLHYAMGIDKIESISRVLIKAGAKRVLKDLKGRQPSYYFMNKSDILRLKEEEEVY